MCTICIKSTYALLTLRRSKTFGISMHKKYCMFKIEVEDLTDKTISWRGFFLIRHQPKLFSFIMVELVL